jgi:uncharacterized radical SAM superfamily protein
VIISYFTPRDRYKTISLTGNWCALNCRFCGRKYLENMIHVNPENFTHVAEELYKWGVRGLLLSGGFRQDGTLPIEPYLEKIRVVKEKLGLFISAHLGLITNKDLLIDLKEVIDVVDYEFTLSPFIVNEVRGLKFTPSRYVEALSRILDAGLHVVPHVFAWHPGLSRELLRKELETLGDHGVGEVTLLVYIDPAMRDYSVKLAEIVLNNIEYIRGIYHGKLYLGCMRPGYIKPLIDPLITEKKLVERIANPHYKVLREHPGEVYDACCSIPITMNTRRLFYIGVNNPEDHYIEDTHIAKKL